MDSGCSEIEFLRDKSTKLILKSTITPKSALQISKETEIPIGTLYQRLKFLKTKGPQLTVRVGDTVTGLTMTGKDTQ